MVSSGLRVEQLEPEFVRRLIDSASIPSVSSDPIHKDDVRRCAEYLAELIKEDGGTAQLVETDGHPAVLGEMAIGGRGAPILLIYNHYDVQPADPKEWENPPFNAFYSSSRNAVFGRGATDDKGPLLTALTAAKIASQEGIGVNLKFVYEGEEESGSVHFSDVVRDNRIFFNGIDSVVFSDSLWLSSGQPAIEYGLRGNVYAHLYLKTSDNDKHSGEFGGVARNPLAELAEVISACVDAKTGFVKIP